MSFLTATARFFGMTLVERPTVTLASPIEEAVDKVIHAREHHRMGSWRLPTVSDALGVPAILRAVSLISSTTGMLSVQGFRNGSLMAEPPRVIVRPDPFESPYTFYAGTAANFAKYGEFVWWIASRDSDGIPNALINVPLLELRVDKNRDNRLFPKYQWGSRTGTRYSPANTAGDFVHVKYPVGEPFALRGEGPLQLARAATSISVESQIWAANFYSGGYPRDIIKHAGQLDPTLRDEMGQLDEDTGLSEADRLKSQYIARDDNTPIIIDQSIESISRNDVNPHGAQMLDARQHQNGDAARMYGIPGSLLEYQQPGASLTYQNLEGEFTKFVKACLQPLYLEPIEQALSDLLTRSTVARFNVGGFLRADIKTRFEVHGIAIDKNIYGPEYAQQVEGIIPGDVEYAPVPVAQTVPFTIPKAASTSVRCPSCNALVARSLGPGSELDCRRCKAEIKIA